MIADSQRLIKDVRRVIDINSEDNRLLGHNDTDTLEIRELIISCIESGCRMVVAMAPARLLDFGHSFSEQEITWPTPTLGRVQLPADFCRLQMFQLSCWKRPVFENQLLEPGTPQYNRMFSDYAGLRGNNTRPMAAIVTDESGRVLEFNAVLSDDIDIETATYQPWPEIYPDGGVDLPAQCYQAAVYQIASLALTSLSDQLSTTMAQLAKQSLAI